MEKKGFKMTDIQKGVEVMPRKIIIYGPPKTGKSTIAAATANALMIPTEDRVSHINCDKTPVITSFDEWMEIFTFLIDEKHSYKRVIIDTLDWFEPILHKYICKEKNLKSLVDDHSKETNFQKGLKYLAPEGWRLFLDNCDVLRSKGLDIIFVAHSQTIVENPPNGDSYDKAVMKIDKHSLSVLMEWADVIAFYDQRVLVKTEQGAKGKKALPSTVRLLHLSGTNPAMLNGNSFCLGDAEVDLEHCTEIMEWMLTDTNLPQNTIKKEKK
jgi:hypothetical protein